MYVHTQEISSLKQALTTKITQHHDRMAYVQGIDHGFDEPMG
jgi:hypothetical protein